MGLMERTDVETLSRLISDTNVVIHDCSGMRIVRVFNINSRENGDRFHILR